MNKRCYPYLILVFWIVFSLIQIWRLKNGYELLLNKPLYLVLILPSLVLFLIMVHSKPKQTKQPFINKDSETSHKR